MRLLFVVWLSLFANSGQVKCGSGCQDGTRLGGDVGVCLVDGGCFWS
jgi:hypothetical protein